ncbi:MAG: DinB family protein [Planctomycetaceae bacterium]
MDLRAAMLLEFDHESQLTRSVLEVVPNASLDFQAEPSLRPIRWNVSHLADIPSWARVILTEAEYDVAPVGGPPHETAMVESAEQGVALFDANRAIARETIETFDLDSLDDSWTLKAGGQTLSTQPRHLVYRMYMVSHVAHHRGHLLAYLRMCGVDTPRLYG